MAEPNPYDGVRVKRSCGLFSEPFHPHTHTPRATSALGGPGETVADRPGATAGSAVRRPKSAGTHRPAASDIAALRIDTRPPSQAPPPPPATARPLSARVRTALASHRLPVNYAPPGEHIVGAADAVPANSARARPLLRGIAFPTKEDPLVKLFHGLSAADGADAAALSAGKMRVAMSRGLPLTPSQRQTAGALMRAEDRASREFIDAHRAFDTRHVIHRAKRVEERQKADEAKRQAEEVMWARLRQRHTDEKMAAIRLRHRELSEGLGRVVPPLPATAR